MICRRGFSLCEFNSGTPSHDRSRVCKKGIARCSSSRPELVLFDIVNRNILTASQDAKILESSLHKIRRKAPGVKASIVRRSHIPLVAGVEIYEKLYRECKAKLLEVEGRMQGRENDRHLAEMHDLLMENVWRFSFFLGKEDFYDS